MNHCHRCGAPIDHSAPRCPKCQALLPGQPPPQAVRRAVATLVEQPAPIGQAPVRATLVEQPVSPGQAPIRATLVESPVPVLPMPAAPVTAAPIYPSATRSDAVQIAPRNEGVLRAGPLRYRALNRLPMAQLLVLDDASDDGELRRIRGARHVIGRERGDTLIPHDNDISAEHAEITCRWRDGKYCWHLNDMKSTNGVFLRVYRAMLRNERDLLLGGRRYEFRAAQLAPTPPAEHHGARATHKFDGAPPAAMEQMLPRLVVIGAQGQERTIPIPRDPALIGSDAAQCQIAISDDLFVNPKHATIFRDERGRWTIEDNQSLNGVWIRVHRVALEDGAEFQLGGQRFKFKLMDAEENRG